MLKWSLVLACLLCVTAAAGWSADDPFARQTPQVDGRVHLVVPTDIDGDGMRDLAVAYAAGRFPEFRAHLAVFFAGPEGYAATPDIDFAFPNDACAFDLDDLAGDGGIDLLVVERDRVAMRELTRDGAGPWRAISQDGTDVLFPPQDGRLPYADLVRDWFGDGAPAIGVPDFDALRFLQRKGGSWRQANEVPLQSYGWDRAQNRPTTGDVGEHLEAGASLPRWFVAGRGQARELVLTSGERVWWYRRDNGTLDPVGHERTFAMLTDVERTQENAGVEATVADMNGDGYADLALNKTGGSLTNFHSAMQIFAGTADGFAAEPSYRMEREGLVAFVRFVDLDGDGRPEMGMPTVEVGLVQIARMFTTQKLKVQVHVFAGGGAGFYGQEPTLTREVTLKVDTTRGVTLRGFPPNFDGDFDGDGRPDLMMSFGNGFAVWRNEGNLKFAAGPMAIGAVEPWQETRPVDLNGDGRADIVGWDDADPAKRGQVLVLFTR